MLQNKALSRIIAGIRDLQALLSKLEKEEGRERGGVKGVKIRTKEKCPRCRKPFTATPLGLICLKCLTTPKRYYIDLWWEGERRKIYSFKDGQPLSSWDLAQRAKELILHEIETGIFDPSRWSRSDAKHFFFEIQWERFIQLKERQVESGELSPGYFAQLCSYQKHLLAFFKGKDVREIKRADVTDFWQVLQDKGLSLKTINNILRLLKGFLNFLHYEEIISRVPDIPLLKVPKKEPEVLDEEEQAILLNFVRERLPQHYPILLFLCKQGVRPGEACALLWEDVDLAKGFVWIRRTFSARKLKDTTKGKRPRLIPLDPTVYAFLLDYTRETVPFPKNFVFTQKNGNHYSDYTLDRAWKKIKEGFLKELSEKDFAENPKRYSLFVKLQKGMRLYDATRHSRITQFISQGKSLYLVQEFAGHSDPRITERYVHLAAEKLKQLFDSPEGKVIPLKKDKS